MKPVFRGAVGKKGNRPRGAAIAALDALRVGAAGHANLLDLALATDCAGAVHAGRTQ